MAKIRVRVGDLKRVIREEFSRVNENVDVVNRLQAKYPRSWDVVEQASEEGSYVNIQDVLVARNDAAAKKALETMVSYIVYTQFAPDISYEMLRRKMPKIRRVANEMGVDVLQAYEQDMLWDVLDEALGGGDSVRGSADQYW